MSEDARGYLLRQFDLAWKLLAHHLDGLSTAECLRRPAERGLHVHQLADGTWMADWPEHEGYSLGPSSIAWLTWHVCFWWTMVVEHNNGPSTLTRHDIPWPGSAEAVTQRIGELHERWRHHLETLTDADLASAAQTRWPFTNRPFGDVVAWLNVELAKNAAEIGFVRFLHAAVPPSPQTS